METSPCRACNLRDEDKNNPVCIRCPLRVGYVKGIGTFLEDPPVKPRPAKKETFRYPMLKMSVSC